MNKRVTAVYDGQVLRPDAPLDLELDKRYIITIQPDGKASPQEDAWDILESLAGSIEAPSDWSIEHDHYLYGTPKKNQSEASE